MRTEKEDFIIKEVSELIRKKREELSMSRTALASELGVDEKQLRRVEKAQSALPLIMLLKLFYILKIDLDILKKYIKDDSILN